MKASKMFPFLFSLLVLSFSFTSVKSQIKQKDQEKIDASIKVLQDFGQMKEKIPKELMEMTQGIIIVPKLINAGFVVGAKEERESRW